MKYLLNSIFLTILLFSFQKGNSQNSHLIDSDFSEKDMSISVKQNSTYTNQTSKKISKIFIYDWNHSYSSMSTPLSKKLYSEYDSSILKSSSNQRGKTLISQITIDNNPVEWERVVNNEDLIEIRLDKELDINQKIKILFEYTLYIPKFIENYGYTNDIINVKNCFFRFVPKFNHEPILISNLSLDDQFFQKSIINLKIKYNPIYSINTNLIKDSSKTENNRNIDYYLGSSVSDISLILNKNKDFKNVKINKINVSSNSKRVLSLKSNNLQNIDKFLLDYFPKNENKNIVLDKNDFKKNSLYPYSEIPDLLDPFDENILNEINLLKNLLHYIFSNSLSIDRRNLFWFSSGLELYYLNKFIEEYHPDLLLIGKFSNLFFIKKHNLSKTKFTNQFRLGYNFVSARNLNQKLLLPSNELTRINYRLSSPAKSFYSLKTLNSYIGEKHFKESILQIINSEKPIAQTIQIQNIFESISSKNLKWFFSDYLNYDGLIDLKVFKKKENFAIKNTMGNDLNFPLPIEIEYLDGTSKKEWFNTNNYESKLDYLNISKIIIDPDKLFLDENYKNNTYLNFKKNNKKTIIRFFSDIDSHENNQIFYRPQFLYNLYDGFSPGITLTNKSPIKKRFTYLVSPFYSFETKNIIGNLNFNLTTYHSKTFSTNYYISLSKFHFDENLSYTRFSPTILLTFRDKNLVSNYKQFLRYKYININREQNNPSDNYGISKFTYINSNPGAKKSYSFAYDLQFNKEIIKNSITLNYRNYFSEFRQYNLRLFIGKFFQNNNTDGLYNFSVDRTTDYLYDNYLFGRSESSGFFSQQYVRYEGAFKSNISEFKPNDFMISLNSGITIWKWIEAYFDYGLFKNKNEPILTGFDSGFRLNIVENYFELFFPIYSSEDFYINKKSYSNRIRFILTLDPENLTSLFTRRWF